MKKTYNAPNIEITIFNSGDNTNTSIELSGKFSNTRANGVGANTYRDMFDF